VTEVILEIADDPGVESLALGAGTAVPAQLLETLERIAIATQAIARAQRPGPQEPVVGTPFLARQLGCSFVWAAEMARKGEIPKSCILPGTGNGKPWKFYRERIEEWLNKRQRLLPDNLLDRRIESGTTSK